VRRLLHLLLLLLLIFPLNVSATATSPEVEKYLWPPKIDREKSADRTTGYYWLTTDTFVGSTRGGEGVSFLSIFGDVQPKCSSLNDPICTKLIADKRGDWWTNVVLSECSLYQSKYPCIEGVATEKQGTRKVLNLVKYVPTQTWQADDSRGLIPGGAAGLWSDNQDDGGIRYLVVFAGSAGISERNGITSQSYPLADFQASIVATRVLKGDFKPDELLADNDGVRQIIGSAPYYCIWVDNGECGYQVPFPESTRLELTANIPDYSGGFLIGRMKDPRISISKRDSGGIKLTLSAAPIEVPLIKAMVRAENASQAIVNYFNNPNNYLCIKTDTTCKKGLIGAGSLASGDTAFEHYANFEKFLEPNAALMMPTWSFRNHQTNLGRCKRTTGFQGLVSTNAAIYEGDPPKLVKGELVYKVAGVHHDSAGEVFKGTYDLAIQSEIGRCIYGLTNSPISASVSIQNSAGENVIATTSFSEKDGWIKVSINGFTFSQPTIKVKLKQEVAAGASGVKPSPTSTPANVIATSKKMTITCTKGKSSKKVTGESPKCPKGFKKK